MNDELDQSVLADIARASAWIARLGEYSPFSGGTVAQESVIDRTGYLALEFLAIDGVSAMAEMAKRLDIHLSSMSRTLARLQEKELVARRRDRENHRVALLEITEHGRTVLDRIRVARAETGHIIFSDWQPEDVRTFSRFLNRYVNELAALYSEGVLPK